MPFLFALYIFAYLDRVNVGYAALAIQRELHFSNTVYGTGAGLFFLSYALFEVPSNMVLLRVGPRRWISLLMLVWGAISCMMPLVHTPGAFYTLRFLLGAAEAGFFPGIVLYLTYWFPQAQRARAIAGFMSAATLSGVVGAPFSAVLLRLDGVFGVSGWKWLFVGEGLPSILFGAIAFFVLLDSPADAAWLPADEREWLLATLAAENLHPGRRSHLRDAFRNSVIWQLAFIYFAISAGLYSLSMWLPVLLKRISHGSDLRVVTLTAVPYIFAAIAMLAIARSSDLRQERRRHLAAALVFATLAFALSGLFTQHVVATILLFVAVISIWGCLGPFWAVPTSILEGDAAAGGIALINSVGALGGFCGPYLMGIVSDRTHSFYGALLVSAGLLLMAAVVAVRLPADACSS
ncbi:MAG: MFS transporter [Acidobacteria bacterium]|nr:MFS transporter [Acidobacteriota bacterium]